MRMEDKNALNNMLECPIMLDTYNDTDCRPLVLVPCGHSVCEKCFKNLKAKICVVCRQPFTSTAMNYALLDVINTQNSQVGKTQLLTQTSQDDRYIWSWQTDSNGPHFEPYLATNQSQIENAYLNYQNNNGPAIVTIKNIRRHVDDVMQDYEIDFIKMLQKNCKTRFIRKILRKQIGKYEWMYYDNDWKPYHSDLQLTLENPYLSYVQTKDPQNAQINVSTEKHKYLIDFKILKQKNLKYGTERAIKRS